MRKKTIHMCTLVKSMGKGGPRDLCGKEGVCFLNSIKLVDLRPNDFIESYDSSFV